VRLPGTLKELYKQLAASSAPVRRVEIPTKDGPIVLEFETAGWRPPAPPPVRKPEAPPDKPARERDTRVMLKKAPPFAYEPGNEAVPS
jgi:hypothetical protein